MNTAIVFSPKLGFTNPKKNAEEVKYLESSLENGEIEFFLIGDVPCLVWNSTFDYQMPQYLASDVILDGSRLSDLSRIEISARYLRVSGGKNIERWEVYAAFCDGIEYMQGSYRFSRVFFSEVYEGHPSEEQVKTALSKAKRIAEEADLTPESILIKKRTAEKKELLGVLDAEMDRQTFEASCLKLDLKPISDSEAAYFYERYSHYAGNYWSNSAIEMARIDLKIHYGRIVKGRLEAEREEAGKPSQRLTTKTRMEGQLWEPCEICGNEPVYMPLMLCEKCLQRQ